MTGEFHFLASQLPLENFWNKIKYSIKMSFFLKLEMPLISFLSPGNEITSSGQMLGVMDVRVDGPYMRCSGRSWAALAPFFLNYKGTLKVPCGPGKAQATGKHTLHYSSTMDGKCILEITY